MAQKNEKSTEKEQTKEKKLGIFEKYLTIWVAICIAIGILLSFIPGFSDAINSMTIEGISIPIGICLFLMMYPATLNLQMAELKKLRKNPKPILLTLLSNWIVAPLIGAGLAYLFLSGIPDLQVREELTVAVILLASSPCTAMVLVWGYLAEGNQEQNVVNTTLNTITLMFLYAPIVSLLTGIQNIQIDFMLLLITVMVFIAIPILLGYLSKKVIVKSKGSEWFENTYRPVVGKVAMVALLTTLIVLFGLNGRVIIENPDKLLLVSAPLLLGFVLVVGYNLLITILLKLKYKQAIITVIIGSSSHFEIAIATAITLYGVGSHAALGTTMGLFWEVPIMLGLVYLGKLLRKKGVWG